MTRECLGMSALMECVVLCGASGGAGTGSREPSREMRLGPADFDPITQTLLVGLAAPRASRPKSCARKTRAVRSSRCARSGPHRLMFRPVTTKPRLLALKEDRHIDLFVWKPA